MKYLPSFSSAILFVISVGAPDLSAQQQTPNRGSSESANPKIDQPREVTPTIPGQPAPKRPDSAQQLPGQQGTIPEVIERQRMVVSPEEVRKAQEALKRRGYDPGATSGNLHTGTQEALQQFQRDNKLPATGVLDEETAKKLGVDIDEPKPASPERGTGPNQTPAK